MKKKNPEGSYYEFQNRCCNQQENRTPRSGLSGFLAFNLFPNNDFLYDSWKLIKFKASFLPHLSDFLVLLNVFCIDSHLSFFTSPGMVINWVLAQSDSALHDLVPQKVPLPAVLHKMENTVFFKKKKKLVTFMCCHIYCENWQLLYDTEGKISWHVAL